MLSDNDIDEIVDGQLSKGAGDVYIRPMFEVLDIYGVVDDEWTDQC